MNRSAILCLALVLISGCTPGSVVFDEQHFAINVSVDLSGTVSITTPNVRAGADDAASLDKAAAVCRAAEPGEGHSVEHEFASSLLTSIGVYEIERSSEPKPDDSCDVILTGRFRHLPSLLASLNADGTYSIGKGTKFLSVELIPLPTEVHDSHSTLTLTYAGVIESSNADEVSADGATHRWAGDPSIIRFKLGIASVPP